MNDFKFKVGDRVRNIAYQVSGTTPTNDKKDIPGAIGTITAQVALNENDYQGRNQNTYLVKFDDPKIRDNGGNWYEWAWELAIPVELSGDQEMQEAYYKWAKFFEKDS